MDTKSAGPVAKKPARRRRSPKPELPHKGKAIFSETNGQLERGELPPAPADSDKILFVGENTLAVAVSAAAPNFGVLSNYQYETNGRGGLDIIFPMVCDLDALPGAIETELGLLGTPNADAITDALMAHSHAVTAIEIRDSMRESGVVDSARLDELCQHLLNCGSVLRLLLTRAVEPMADRGQKHSAGSVAGAQAANSAKAASLAGRNADFQRRIDDVRAMRCGDSKFSHSKASRLVARDLKRSDVIVSWRTVMRNTSFQPIIRGAGG